MAYTPELSIRGSALLRRIAWYRKHPMTLTLEEIVLTVGMEINKIDNEKAICKTCKDRSCSACYLKEEP